MPQYRIKHFPLEACIVRPPDNVVECPREDEFAALDAFFADPANSCENGIPYRLFGDEIVAGIDGAVLIYPIIEPESDPTSSTA